MKIKVLTETMRQQNFEYEAEIGKKIVLGKKGLFGCELSLKPVKISEDTLEFKASGKNTKYNILKFLETGERTNYSAENGIYKIRKGEQIKFLDKPTEVKDASSNYVITIE